MSMNHRITANQTLDCQGLACPMPIVRTKKAIDQLEPGQVIEVLATDKGSLADMQGWARTTGHHYLGTVQEGELLKHYIRKASSSEVQVPHKFPHTTANDALVQLLASSAKITVLDVREPAEYAFHHIPDAKSIPFGELEHRAQELDQEEEIYVICRTGMRSDMACQLLQSKGFSRIHNVEPGMSDWNGPTTAEV